MAQDAMLIENHCPAGYFGSFFPGFRDAESILSPTVLRASPYGRSIRMNPANPAAFRGAGS